MSTQFLEAVKHRRTYYALKKESPIDDKKIQEIFSQVVLNTPSAFNSQSTRVVLLLHGEHDKFWELTKAILKNILPPERFAATEQRMNGFLAGYGTALFFIDKTVVADFQKSHAQFADKFPMWSTQADGMAQYVAWTALEQEGFGANLQHYNPLVDAKVQELWNVPKDWELKAQLVFGTPVAQPGPKEFSALDERFKVYGA